MESHIDRRHRGEREDEIDFSGQCPLAREAVEFDRAAIVGVMEGGRPEREAQAGSDHQADQRVGPAPSASHQHRGEEPTRPPDGRQGTALKIGT
jgi:hypothetical protein